MLVLVLLVAACSGDGEDTAAPLCDQQAVEPTTGDVVYFCTDPAPVDAGVEVEFTLQVRDAEGDPIEALQQAHERMVHTLFISEDLSSFQHVHQEDFTTITADDLRTSTFRFPIRWPMSGAYRVVFDFAHDNLWLAAQDWLDVGGSPAQSDTQDLDYTTERDAGDVHVSLRWDVEPYAGYEAAWTVTVTDAATGADITDMVQWLGADAHSAVASADLAFVSHTHAWFPGMEDMAPGHEMPVLYSGPELPFHFTFPAAGPHKMWVQFARADAPDDPYVASFAFDVLP